MKLFSRFTLKVRLILAFAVFGIVPLALMAAIAWTNAQKSLYAAAEDEMLLIRKTKGEEIQRMLNTMMGQVIALGQSKLTRDAAKDFTVGFQNYSTEFTSKPSLEDARKTLNDYYQNQFGNEFAKQNSGNKPADLEKKINSLPHNSLALQYSYIAKNSNPLGSKHLMDSFDDGTSWSKAHSIYHNTYRGYIQQFGFYDVFIIEPTDGIVIYSVFKELDFATSLKSGAYSETGLAEAFNKALAGTAGQAYITDMGKYFPSFEAPAAFMSSRIEEDGKLVGVLIFQVPIDKINSIMTADQKWKEAGFGDSGEVYLVGQDKRMRSIDRFLVEQPDLYFSSLEASQKAEDIIYIKNKKSSVLGQIAEGPAVEKALQGESGFIEYTNANGIPEMVSYGPVKVGDLNWAVISEVRRSEALDSVVLGRIISMLMLGSIIAVIGFAWMFSSSLSNKLTTTVSILVESGKDSLDKSEKLKEASQKVSSASTEQASAIQETVATLDEIAAMVNKSVDYAGRSAEKASESHSIAGEGKKVVEEMRRAMGEIDQSNSDIMGAINESNQRISKIVGVINEIASKTKVINDIVFQTKLLSFNASVEAARAGEHGKGFAVVAEEVGNLAQMSGSAAQEIESMLSRSVTEVETVINETGQSITRLVEAGKTKVESGVAIAARCEEVLDEVVSNVAEVKSMMGEVAHGAKEQAEGVSNISSAMNQLDEATHANSAVAIETSEYAESMSKGAGNLMNTVAALGREVYGNQYAHGKTSVEEKRETPKATVTPITKGKRPTAASRTPKTPVKAQSKTNINEAPKPELKKASGENNVPDANDGRFEDI